MFRKPKIQTQGVRIRKKVKISKILLYILVAALLVFTVLPMICMVCRAFMPMTELFIYPPRIFVRHPTLQNFVDLLSSLSSSTVPFTRYIFNSLWVTIVTVFLSVVVCSMGAYGMVKHKPVGAATIFTIVIAALSFSGHVTKIPNYMIVSGVGLIDSYAALIVPSSSPYRRRKRVPYLLDHRNAAAEIRMEHPGSVQLRIQLERFFLPAGIHSD